MRQLADCLALVSVLVVLIVAAAYLLVTLRKVLYILNGAYL